MYTCQVVIHADTVSIMNAYGLGPYLVRLREGRGWSITDAAAHIGMSKSHLSQLEKGKIGLPNAALRRQIANAYSIRHVDILVAAGELDADELPREGAIREPFPRGTAKAEVVQRLAELPDEKAIDVLRYILFRLAEQDIDVDIAVIVANAGAR
jgi:transcriptional regulator with XRE-family HTH domain